MAKSRLKNHMAELMALYRLEKGQRLTQMALSDATGASQSTVSGYVNNKVTQYHAETVVNFCKFFGVGLEEFLFIAEADEDS